MEGRPGRRLGPGKLPAELLGRLLATHAPLSDPRVLVGPGIGEDAAAIELAPSGGRILVAKADPITFVAEDIGLYAVTINANDLACVGARPSWFLATVLLPEGGTSEADAERVLTEIGDACRARGIALVGGHTEVTGAVTRPVVAGFLIGEAEPGRLLRSAGARVGDAILVARGVPIEAVSIVARERAAEVSARHGEGFLARCRDFLRDPGIDVAPVAAAAMEGAGVHAMHDPTEGGIATGLRELATAAGVGMRIEADRIEVLEEGRILCADFGMDPLGAIASGALILAVDPGRAGDVAARIGGRGWTATQVGRIVERGEGVRWRRSGREEDIPAFEPDEIVKLFA